MLTDLRKPKLRRDQLSSSDLLCDHCTAKCCRYFALPIETPKTHEDWEFVRWYLLHDGATVFRDEGAWYLLVHSACKELQNDNRCGIYNARPLICRDYSTVDCEYEDDWLYEQYLETSEQAAEFADAVLPRKQSESIRGPKPPLLPVLTSADGT